MPTAYHAKCFAHLPPQGLESTEFTRHKRHDTKNPKVDCCKANLQVLGIELGVATNIHEVLDGGK